jgi:hypothetical protein
MVSDVVSTALGTAYRLQPTAAGPLREAGFECAAWVGKEEQLGGHKLSTSQLNDALVFKHKGGGHFFYQFWPLDALDEAPQEKVDEWQVGADCAALKEAMVRDSQHRKQTFVKSRLRKEEISDFGASYVPLNFNDSVVLNYKRLAMLKETRISDPLRVIFDLTKLGKSTFPDVLRSLQFWLVTISYTVCSVLTRTAVWPKSEWEESNDAMDTSVSGMGVLVSFTLVFYFGYCYTRYSEHYMEVRVPYHAHPVVIPRPHPSPTLAGSPSSPLH